MRSIVLSAGMSLDGYIARPDGSVDWLKPDPEYDQAPFFRTIDAALMGRKTWDVFKQGPSLNMPTYVYTRSQPAGQRDGIEFGSATPSEVRDMKSRPGKSIWLVGGGNLALQFLQEDLVDQMDLGVMPVLLGQGIPLFPAGFPQRNWKLASQKTFRSGMISLSYLKA